MKRLTNQQRLLGERRLEGRALIGGKVVGELR